MIKSLRFMELSVIIVSFNVREFLKPCLISVIKASENIDCEIFVVDNNSTDDSCDMIEREFPEVVLIRNKINAGFSVANNQAINLARGRFILLLNPDTLISEDTFSKCINFMNEHPDAGATGVRMINGEGRFLPESKRNIPTPDAAFFKIFGLSYLFPKSRFLNKYYTSDNEGSKTCMAEIISGAFMFIRREALTRTGLLDEDFFMYGEDIDLSYRLLQAGYNNYYFPETQIIHFKGKSTGKEQFTDILHFYNAMRIYVRKRSAEGKFKFVQCLIIPAIYLRQGFALINRFIRIIIHR
jgi:GT2 family glycosyltransferase